VFQTGRLTDSVAVVISAKLLRTAGIIFDAFPANNLRLTCYELTILLHPQYMPNIELAITHLLWLLN